MMAALLVLPPLLVPHSAASAPAPPRHLFLDDSAIESQHGVALRMHPAEIDDSLPRLEPGGPGGGEWEGGRIIGYNSVVDNGTHVLLYYDAFSVNGPHCSCLSAKASGSLLRTDPCTHDCCR